METLPEVPAGFDFHGMIDTLVCQGPIVAWDMYWDSAFSSTTAPYWKVNRGLFESFLLSAIYTSKETCKELGSIVKRMNIFVTSDRARKKLGRGKLESIHALTQLFQGILDKLNVVCDKGNKDNKKGYGATFQFDNRVALQYLKKDLSEFSCKVGGGLLQRWKTANGMLVGKASEGVAGERAIVQDDREKAFTNPSYVQFWAQKIVDEFEKDSSLGDGKRIIQRFKEMLGIRDRKDPRWTILMRAFYQVYITSKGSILGDFAATVIKSLEKQTNFSIGPLIQNDPHLNSLSVSLKDSLVWPELASEEEGHIYEKDESGDHLNMESWTLLNHFYERLGECRDNPSCLVEGLEKPENYEKLAEAFVNVRSLTKDELFKWEEPLPTNLDLEWDLMTLHPKEWEEIKERLKPK